MNFLLEDVGRPTLGGGAKRPTLNLRIFLNLKYITDTKLDMPLHATILPRLSRNRVGGHDRSTVNDL